MKIHALLLMVLVPGICAGQTAPADETTATHLVRAAGMPLNDGTLAPGMLTVRIVQGAFTRNLAGQVVQVEVMGGKVESAPTGEDGRAQFAHLPLGARVRASATVAGARLESDFFEIPSQSGVRVLLVSDDGAAPQSERAIGATAPIATPTLTESPVAPVPPQAPASTDDTTVAVIQAVLATATCSAFGFLFLTRRARQ